MSGKSNLFKFGTCFIKGFLRGFTKRTSEESSYSTENQETKDSESSHTVSGKLLLELFLFVSRKICKGKSWFFTIFKGTLRFFRIKGDGMLEKSKDIFEFIKKELAYKIIMSILEYYGKVFNRDAQSEYDKKTKYYNRNYRQPNYQGSYQNPRSSYYQGPTDYDYVSQNAFKSDDGVDFPRTFRSESVPGFA